MEHDATIQRYLRKLKPEQWAILKNPEEYIGDAPERTEAVCELSEIEIDQIEKKLTI
jgi:hypothetical protein